MFGAAVFEMIHGLPPQHASPQEFEARAPVHLTLDHCQPSNVPLDWPLLERLVMASFTASASRPSTRANWAPK
jgi:hypothetical protein